MKRTVRIVLGTVALATIGLLPVFASGKTETVKIGYVNVMDNAPVHVAYEADFYKQQGLDVELVQFASGTDLIKSLVTGRLDAGVLGFTNALTWASRGADLKIVGGAQQGYHSLLARTESGISSVSDLKGKSLASQKQGSTADIVLDNVVLRDAGLEKTDLTMRYVSPAVAVQSLVSGAADAAFLFEPYSSIARYTAPVKQIYEIGEVWPFPCMVVITSGETLDKRPEALRSILEAQKRAIDLLENDPAKAANLITKYFLPDGTLETPSGTVDGKKVIEEAVKANTFSSTLSAQDISRMKEVAMMMEKGGVLEKSVDVDSFLDLSWQEEAQK